MYWKASESVDIIEPLDIETTGYVLLTILARGRRQDIVEGASVVRWLTKYRDNLGGFSSTQVKISYYPLINSSKRKRFMSVWVCMQLHLRNSMCFRNLLH